MRWVKVVAIFIAAVSANAYASSDSESDVSPYAYTSSDSETDAEVYASSESESEPIPHVLVKRAKAKLSVPKKLQKGSIKQNELEDTIRLGEAALVKHGYKSGTVVFGWHDEGSEDPVNHFTIQPEPSGLKIHVHKDGSSTQGRPAAAPAPRPPTPEPAKKPAPKKKGKRSVKDL